MSNLSTRLGQNETSLSSPPVLDLESHAPDVARALFTQQPELVDALAVLRERIPLAPSNSPNRATGYYRLPHHHRSICFTVTDPGPDTWLESDVLAFKGTELVLRDGADYLAWMRTARIRQEPLPMAECFPLVAGVAPGTMSMYEAIREFRVTADFQAQHLATYGSLARAPVPLMVYRMPAQYLAQCAAMLRDALSDAAYERIDPRVRPLALWVHYYPSAPLRADFAGRLTHLSVRPPRLPAPVEVLRSWLALLARMLYLGLVPFAPWAMGRGCCLDPGNAGLDGGIHDCDSLVPIEMIKSNGVFYTALMWSLDCVRRSFAHLMGVAHNEPDPIFRHISLAYVMTQLQTAIAEERRDGLRIDERVFDLVRNDDIDSLRRCTLSDTSLSFEPYRANASV